MLRLDQRFDSWRALDEDVEAVVLYESHCSITFSSILMVDAAAYSNSSTF